MKIHRSKRVGDRDHWLLIIHLLESMFSFQETSLSFGFFITRSHIFSCLEKSNVLLGGIEEFKDRTLFNIFKLFIQNGFDCGNERLINQKHMPNNKNTTDFKQLAFFFRPTEIFSVNGVGSEVPSKLQTEIQI